MTRNILTGNEVKELIKKYHQTHDIRLRNYIVEKCLYLCEKIAKKYALKYDMEYGDVLSLTHEGLIDAVEKYDESTEKNFYSFAPVYITAFIFDGIRKWNGLGSEYMYKFYRYCYDYEQTTGIPHNSFEAMDYAAMQLRILDGANDFAIQRLWTAVNLYYPVSYSRVCDSICEKEDLNDSIELEDTMDDRPEFDAEELLTLTSAFMDRINKDDVVSSQAISNEIKEKIDELLNKKRICNKDVIEQHYGLNGNKEKTFRAIAEEKKVTYAWTQQMEKLDFERMRKYYPRRLRELESFIGYEPRNIYDEPEELGIPNVLYYRKGIKK